MDTPKLIEKIRARSRERREIMCEYGDQDTICDLLDEAADGLARVYDEAYIAKLQNDLYREALHA
jgi:hypothetical protein